MKSFFTKASFLLIVLIGLSMVELSVLAQNSSNRMSLTQANCRSISGSSSNRSSLQIGADRASLFDRSEDVVIGREVFTSVFSLVNAFNAADGYYIIQSGSRFGQPAISCRITPPGEAPRFRTLRLAFGMNEENPYTDNGGVVQVTIYVDGNPVEARIIRMGTQAFVPVNIANSRSVSIEAECTTRTDCSAIVFVQALLE